jgi:5-methylthioadenosine/S-adenosylhomocysteine deaminase
MSILIEKADWIVTVDASRRLLQSASILIEDDRIAFVGPASDLSPDADVDRRIDGSGLLIAPGFVDTHVHNTQQLGRGLADECDLPKQLLERLYGYESILTSHEAHLAAKL